MTSTTSETTTKSTKTRSLLAVFRAPLQLSSGRHLAHLLAAQKLLEKLCDQLALLTNREADLRIRYIRAKVSPAEMSRNTLHMQLTTIVGVKAQYEQYAERLAYQIVELYSRLTPTEADIVS